MIIEEALKVVTVFFSLLCQFNLKKKIISLLSTLQTCVAQSYRNKI